MRHLHDDGLRQEFTHTHLITFSQVVLSSVAINRVCGRALANSFIESLVVTHKDAHTRSHGSDVLPDSYTQEELRGCQGDPFPCQTLILCQRYLSLHICSHLHPSPFSFYFSASLSFQCSFYFNYNTVAYSVLLCSIFMLYFCALHLYYARPVLFSFLCPSAVISSF